MVMRVGCSYLTEDSRTSLLVVLGRYSTRLNYRVGCLLLTMSSALVASFANEMGVSFFES